MTDEERELHRKLQVLRHAEQSGHVSKTCRYFGICRASFLSLACRVSPGCRRGIGQPQAHPEDRAKQDQPRDRGEGPSSTLELPSGANPHCLVPAALPRHQDLGSRCLSHPAVPSAEPAAQRNAAAQVSYHTVQQAGAGSSNPGRRQIVSGAPWPFGFRLALRVSSATA